MALLPGLAVFALIAGAWLVAVWQNTQFQDTVVRGELGNRLVSGNTRAKPFWYYVPLLFGRIAPWPLAAILGVVLARRRGDRWREVRFVALWFAAFFVFFSAIPAKRHDLLLPVYPPVFMLAGLGVHYLTGLLPARWFRALVWPLAAVGIVGPVVVIARDGIGALPLTGMVGAHASLKSPKLVPERRKLIANTRNDRSYSDPGRTGL